MDNEQTNKTDIQGITDNKDLENDSKDISEYDKALELVKRREEASKVELEILSRKEKLAANALLSGDSGGNVKPTPPKEISDKEYSEKAMRGEIGDDQKN